MGRAGCGGGGGGGGGSKERDRKLLLGPVAVVSEDCLLKLGETGVVRRGRVCLLVACLTSQQHASVSQGRICTDNFTCCHTEIEAADQTFHLTQSQYTDTGPTSPSADPITPGAWHGSHWSANFFKSLV